MSEDRERVRDDAEKKSDDAIERRRDVEATTDDFEGHRHVPGGADRHTEKHTEKHTD